MKRVFLLSVLAGVMVVGSASALPSLEQRQALCEKHPDKYVWVSKNNACIPINPCEANDKTIGEAYCIVGASALPANIEKAKLLVEKYTQNVMGTTMSDLNVLDNRYYSLETSDGGYYVLHKGASDEEINVYLAAQWSAWAHGYDWSGLKNTTFQVSDEKTCNDIIDFASVFSGDTLSGKFKDGYCTVPYEE